MTCREFKHVMASLTLSNISQRPEEPVAAHAAECPKCESWLRERRMLAGAMQSVSLRTAACAAGPNVESALLQAFRQQRPTRHVQGFRFTPVALRLSRWFEVGAYAAVAAACLIALFLGYQVWHGRTAAPVEGRNVPGIVQPAPPAAQTDSNSVVASAGSSARRSDPSSAAANVKAARQAHSAASQAVLTDETLAKAGYTDLMFCDPLSCSSDAQVVRMELPVQGSAGAADGQTVMADVVVGDDGLVRAVRILN